MQKYINAIQNHIPNMRTIICVLGIMCFLTSCHGVPDETRFMGCLHWHESKEIIALADSLDQTEHVIYDDTAALGITIRSLDNPFGRLFQRNTLGKAYYYMGRNYSSSNQIPNAADCYIEADRLQIDDPICRGRINSNMGYICTQNNNDSLALIFYKRASEDFKESGNEWRYAQMLLTVAHHCINLHHFLIADSLLQVAQTYPLDSAYQARYYETCGLYHYEQQQYDSALVYFQRGLDYWQSEEDKCFSYLKILQIYFDLNELHIAIPYAKLILSTSDNPNYISNAYYCLMQDAKTKNDTPLLSLYAHAREDANRLLDQAISVYAEATPKLVEYLQNPHPLRWVWITLSVVVAVCILLAIGIWIYRKQSYTAHQQIDTLLMQLQNQEERLVRELHYHRQKEQIAQAQNRYRIPQNRWLDYSVLRRDLDYWLHDWIEALDKLPLLEREKIFCILSLVYSHLTDVDIAGYMCYSKSGIRMLKNRILKKTGISAAEFFDFLQNLTYLP